MDKLSKSISELTTDDSGSSTDKAEELSQSSNDTGETNSVGLFDLSPTKLASSSRSTTPINTRYGHRIRSRLRNSDGVSSATPTDTEEASSSHSMSTRSGKRNDATLKKLTHKESMKFMENFDPEHSNRERKKLTRQISSSGKRKPTLYDEKGVLMAAEVDLCDCLEEECPGCHFPCPKCHSNKCGHECRQNRRWTYEEIWVEGSDTVIYNPLLNTK